MSQVQQLCDVVNPGKPGGERCVLLKDHPNKMHESANNLWPKEKCDTVNCVLPMDHRGPCAIRAVQRANDTQVAGDHYVKHGDFQPWDAWWLWNLNAFQGAIIKYIVRYRDKNGVEDLKKARHYIDKLIELEERK